VDLDGEQLRGAPRYQATARVFEALDGRQVQFSGRRWLIEVYSVTDQAGARWVQLGLRGESDRLMTLKLPPGGSERDALEGLGSVLSEPTPMFEGLDVA
jgi:hypothetical protein